MGFNLVYYRREIQEFLRTRERRTRKVLLYSVSLGKFKTSKYLACSRKSGRQAEAPSQTSAS